MRFIILSFLWLVGVPVVAMYLTDPRFALSGRLVNTSEETAAKIRPGMTIAEAEAIIGGPPGEYLEKGEHFFRFASGNEWPHVTLWVSSQGEIAVCDGWYGIQRNQSGEHEGWSHTTGIVQSVSWKSRRDGDESTSKLRVILCILFPSTLFTIWYISRELDRINQLDSAVEHKITQSEIV